MFASFESKSPHSTLCLNISLLVPGESDCLAALEAQLQPLGWSRAFDPAPPLPDGRQEVIFSKPGTALFQGWTPAEHAAFLPPVRELLRRCGFGGRIPHNKLTWRDLE